jgi:hypothetical protein
MPGDVLDVSFRCGCGETRSFMYGLEKKAGDEFSFDLEKEIKDKPSRGKQILEMAETRIQEIKKALREGANEKDFDKLGILLNGYAALQKVLRKVTK